MPPRGVAARCAGQIRVSADINVLPHERRRVWEAECESLLDLGAVHCARTLYACLLQVCARGEKYSVMIIII